MKQKRNRNMTDQEYQFRITLRDTIDPEEDIKNGRGSKRSRPNSRGAGVGKPAVWRQIQVPEYYTFWDIKTIKYL
jgi:hypothetical protein